jgi:hypothetical protein
MVPTYRVCRTIKCDVIKRRAPVYGYGSRVKNTGNERNRWSPLRWPTKPSNGTEKV